MAAQMIDRELGRNVDANEAERLRRQLRALSVQHQDGLIDDEEMRRRSVSVKARLAEVQHRPSRNAAVDAMRIAGSMAVALEKATPEERQRIVSYCFDEIEVTGA